MDNERRSQIIESLDNEPSEAWTQEWRKDLTAEELDFVAEVDDQYCKGISAICTAILVRERLRSYFHPLDLQEVETIQDHCRLRLRDGRLLLARLSRDGTLRLDEIDGVC